MDRHSGPLDHAVPPSLLLVEDSEADAVLFKAMVKSSRRLQGATLIWVRGIGEAVDVLASMRPNCVLLDLGLPDAEGLSGLWALRRADEHAAIVVLTGMDDDSVALAAVREGAQDYVVKEKMESAALARTIFHAIHRQHVIAQLAKQQHNVQYLATHDALTGLANRRFLEEPANSRHAEVLKADGERTLILIDLNGFKAINDDRGHAIGDEILKAVANRLLLCVRASDLAARLGGDEFVLMLASRLTVEAEVEFVRKLRDAVAEPVNIGAENLSVSASIGIAHSPIDGTSLRQLLLQADRRMYDDKMQSKSQQT
jgi:diguanylate cyclase (GGDEF)-like protein